jgi:hypothetical protein
VARQIQDRLAKLAERRSGTDRLDRLPKVAADSVLAKSLLQESWQKRARTQPFTRYALGAMEAVDAEYTRIGLETAERVGKQLDLGLAQAGIPVAFELQGSVPLDVHVRGVSDVDLLALHATYFTYYVHGARARAGAYTSPSSCSSIDVLSSLRREAEKILKDKYPAAKVDCTGGKCIAISGGSLARPVDVVPSHWVDTIAYQTSGMKHDRGVAILNKKVPESFDNYPFLHIKRVSDSDIAALGGLKKAIRLTKNVKNDAENEIGAAKLPSFDIAALLYHADQAALRSRYLYELAILLETQRFLDWCWHNQTAAKSLRTPDGLRTILDTEAKIEGLLVISSEMDALAREVAREQNTGLRFVEPTWAQVGDALRNVHIPAAA